MTLNEPDEVLHREIDSAMIGLDSALEDCDRAIAKLTRRLAPYTAPHVSTPHASTRDGKPNPHANAAHQDHSEFYKRVAAFSDQIRVRTEHIENLTSSLDI